MTAERISTMSKTIACALFLALAACDPFETPKCSASDTCHWQKGVFGPTLVRDRDSLKVITIINNSVCFWDGSCGGDFATEDAAKADGERAAYHGRHAIGG
jgi:hypothetical protein